jgi:phosphoglycerate dehydrogenase-like enzyme
MPTVVLASTFLSDITAQLRQDLPDMEVVAIDLGTRDRPPQDLSPHASVLARADALLPIRGVIDERVMDLAPGTRIIQQFGVGVDTVDREAARRRRIPVCNVPSRFGGNADSVAEMALMHLIAAGRDLKRLQAMVAAQDFGAPFGYSLFGKTVCIVGFGNIGRALARLLRPFGGRVIGIRRRPGSGRVGSAEVWPVGRLPEALAIADFVAVTIPLSETTEGIVGADAFAALKPGARVVNVSRGGTVDRDALLDGLRSGNVAAAGLDVFWQEPVPAGDPILEENVTATPHCGGLTDHMLSGTSRVAAENIRRAISGGRPRYRVRL